MDSYFESWRAINEEGRDGKMCTRTVKTQVKCKVSEMVTEFCNLIEPYMIHLGNILRQHNAIKKLKHDVLMESKSLLVHVDFSENFQCKYTTEIQSIHFGGNRTQVTLHTGVLYSATGTQSFCTISPDFAHDPIAILKHLEPILSQHEYK